MSKTFNRALERLFKSEMSSLTQYTLVKLPRKESWPGGERAFKREQDGTAFWITLLFSYRGTNEFAVEVGWSYLGRFPELSTRPNLTAFSDEMLDEYNEALLRLRPLCGSRTDSWTVAENRGDFEKDLELLCNPLTDDEAMQRAAPLVQDAMNCIKSHGLALAEKVLTRGRPTSGDTERR